MPRRLVAHFNLSLKHGIITTYRRVVMAAIRARQCRKREVRGRIPLAIFYILKNTEYYMKHPLLALLFYSILEIAHQANNLEIISQKFYLAFMGCMLLIWVAWLTSLIMPHLAWVKRKTKGQAPMGYFLRPEHARLIEINGIASRDLSAEWAKIFQSAGVASQDVFMGILHD